MYFDTGYFGTDASRWYCYRNFHHYTHFALLPFTTAFFNSDIGYTHSQFLLAFRYSGTNHSDDPYFGGLMANLIYEDQDFFNTDELRFFLELDNYPYMGTKILSDETIEAQRQALLYEEANESKMFSLHAKYLLKALDFWKLRFNEKKFEWFQAKKIAYLAMLERRDLKEANAEAQEEETIDDDDDHDDDDGYYSSEDD